MVVVVVAVAVMDEGVVPVKDSVPVVATVEGLSVVVVVSEGGCRLALSSAAPKTSAGLSSHVNDSVVRTSPVESLSPGDSIKTMANGEEGDNELSSSSLSERWEDPSPKLNARRRLWGTVASVLKFRRALDLLADTGTIVDVVV